jgi:hypothetical protein
VGDLRPAPPRIDGVAPLPLLLAIAAALLGPAQAGPSQYADPTRGVSALVPSGWHARVGLTALGFPREVVTLASFPLRPGGNCGPDKAVRAMPADGALVFVLEYRPARGPVWSGGLRRSAFPPRPARLRVPRRAPGGYECFGRGYLLRFRDADRPLQMMVALGPRATAARRRDVERVLDGLRFAPLPAPPPDPYEGWPTLIDESGDSLRAPPRWTSLVAGVPRRLPRPRTLFLATSEPLAGLARGRRLRVGALPGPGATPGLTQLSPHAVVLWVTEAEPGGPSPAFPALAPRQAWPAPADFREVRGGPAARWPALAWRRAGMSWRGLRFTAWIAAAPRAGAPTIARAEQAAASVALASGLRACRRSRRGACRRPLPRRLPLTRAPYLGVACPTANSIACDRVGLGVWLRGRATRLTATIDGRTFALRPPRTRDGFWNGFLKPAGLVTPGRALHVTPDRGRYYWEGRHPVRTVVHLSATIPGGAHASAFVAVDLHAGYG